MRNILRNANSTDHAGILRAATTNRPLKACDAGTNFNAGRIISKFMVKRRRPINEIERKIRVGLIPRIKSSRNFSFLLYPKSQRRKFDSRMLHRRQSLHLRSRAVGKRKLFHRIRAPQAQTREKRAAFNANRPKTDFPRATTCRWRMDESLERGAVVSKRILP